jgi:ketosteroid isomerase-like protein
LTSAIVAPSTSAAGQILAVIEGWRAAAGQRDIATVAGFYTKDAQLFPPNTAPVQGRGKASEEGGACFLYPTSR